MDKFTGLFDKDLFGLNKPSAINTPPAIMLPPPDLQDPPRQFVVKPTKDAAMSVTNCIGVSQRDFRDGEYLLLNQIFVFTTKCNPEIEPGTIWFNGNQRAFGNFVEESIIQVARFDMTRFNGKNPYADTIEIEIKFRKKSLAIKDQFKQDDMAKEFIRMFENQVLQPTQSVLFRYQGQGFNLTVKTISNKDVHGSSRTPASRDVNTKAILVKNSTLIFYSGDNLVNLDAGSGRPRANPIISPDFKLDDMGIGGLGKEFSEIFRRAFESRTISPDLAEKLNVKHVKGLLLYGPPGTGKTLIARQIGKMLNVREPKIVNGPEMLSKYVGSSEENIRNLFKDAEAEQKQKGDNSQLHIIIFDELDSVFKQRGSRGDGTGVGDNVVNQLLAKMDGVDQLNNILIIGMTNRLDLIDKALLRPGRFEIQIEISLPDETGRQEILKIHTKKMRENGLLDSDLKLEEIAYLTKNFTGAELQGLTNSAISFAIHKHVKVGTVATVDNKSIAKMKVSRNDFLNALNEVKPAFGVNEEDLSVLAPHGIIKFSPFIDEIFRLGKAFTDEIKDPSSEGLISILLHGPDGSGKTAIASTLALQSGFPFIKLLSAEAMLGMSEPAKIQYIDSAFRDAYRTPLNILVIDNIELLISYVAIGPRFSNDILQTIKIGLTSTPPNGRKLLVIGTTSDYSALRPMKLNFTKEIGVPPITALKEFSKLMHEINFLDEAQRAEVVEKLQVVLGGNKMNISVKSALSVLNTSKFLKSDVDEIVYSINEAVSR